MEPVTLRHKDAPRQSAVYGAFALVVLVTMVAAIALALPGRWWIALALSPVLGFLGYSAVRLLTLQVRLDDAGIWEPNPFRLTYVTPWDDVAKARKVTSAGAMRVSFIGVEIVHRDGDTHEVVALKTQAGAAYAEPAVQGWIEEIRLAKERATRPAE